MLHYDPSTGWPFAWGPDCVPDGDERSGALDLRYLQRDSMAPRRLSTVIRQLREKQELSQLALAKKAGVAQGYISSLEAGEKKNPSIVVLRKLAKALGVPVTQLLE